MHLAPLFTQTGTHRTLHISTHSYIHLSKSDGSGPVLIGSHPLVCEPPRRQMAQADMQANAYPKRKRVNIHGPTSWRPRTGLGRSSKKCEHVAGARCAAEPTMTTCKPQCPRALQPHGKCENGLRSGSYVLAAARWPWQIVQETRAERMRNQTWLVSVGHHQGRPISTATHTHLHTRVLSPALQS